jgi:hypothetical protein
MTALAETGAPPAAAEPQLLLTGGFNLYKLPDGNLVVVWKRKGEDGTGHRLPPIPLAMLAPAAAAKGITLDEFLAELLDGKQ